MIETKATVNLGKQGQAKKTPLGEAHFGWLGSAIAILSDAPHHANVQ